MLTPPPSQKNINYGTITAGGNVHIGDIIYVIERDFVHSILFLRVEKSEAGYEAMLSVKGPDDAPVSLLRERVQLPVSDELFAQVADFQNLRRGADQAMRLKSPGRLSAQALENNLPGAIYDSFFAGDIGVVCTDFLTLLQSGKISDLLLVISTEDESAQNLPWEMVLPRLTVGANDSLPRDNFGLIRSREKNLASFNRQGPTATAAPIKLLFIPALPEDLSERSKMLEIEDEQRKIIDAVSRLEATGTNQPKLVMEILDSANLAEIKDALQAHSHDIVHISGHGAYLESLKEGILCLEDEDGNEEEVTGRALGQVLKSFSSIKLLVLSACETAVGGPDGSTAEQIAAVGLPAVLAMRFSVTDAGARLFTEKLYERLAYGNSLSKAMHDARLVLWDDVQQRRTNAPQVAAPAEWFTPVLYQNQVIGPLVLPGRYDEGTRDRFYPKIDFVKGKHTRLIGGGFIGRKRLRIQLRQCFARHEAVCLYGLGGLGKTTTAEAFADYYRKRYSYNAEIFRNGPNISETIILNRILEKWKARTQPDAFMAQQVLSQLESPDTSVDDKLQLLIDNCLNGQLNILIFDNFEDVQTDSDDAQHQMIVSESLRSFLRYLLENAPPTCQILFTTRYRITDLDELVIHLPVDKMTYAEEYRYLNYSDILCKLPLAERAIIHRRIDGHPRALEFLETLIHKDRQFDLTRFDATLDRAEGDIFANLLLRRLLAQLSELERHVLSTASVFFSRTPVAALAAVLETTIDELAPVLTALRNWSLCFWDVTLQLVEVHALTRAWLRTQNRPAAADYKALSHRAGAFFREQPTWDDEELALAYFEQAESWDDYATAAFRLAGHYRTIGFYPTAEALNELILTKDISPKINAQALNGLGLHNLFIGEYDAALTYWNHCLSIQQQIGDKNGEGTTFNNISQIYQARGEYDVALTYCEQSLSITRQIGDKRMEGTTLNNIGLIYHARGEYESALTYWEQSLSITRQIGDKKMEGTTLNNISQIYQARGEYDVALTYCEQSLSITRQIGDKKMEGTTLNNIGLIYHARGEYESALTYWEQSLSITRQIGDKQGEGTTLNNISQIYQVRGEYESALTYWEQSLSITRQIGDKKMEGTTLNNISQIYQARGEYDVALTYCEQSLSITRQIGDKKMEGTTLNNIGVIYHARGEYESALTYWEQSLSIQQQIGDKQGEGTTLNNIGLIYHARGEYQTALTYWEQSLSITRQIGDKKMEGTTLNNISQIYQVWGEYQTALSYLEQSLSITRQIGDKQVEGITLNNIGLIYHARGEYESALTYWEQSLSIQQQIGDKKMEGTTLNNISQIYQVRGEYQTALSYLEQSLSIQQQIGDKQGEGTTLNNIGLIYHARGEYESALTYWEQSLSIQQQIGDKKMEGTTLNNISQIYQVRGEYQTALSYLEQSLSITRQIGDKQVEGITLHNMGILYSEQFKEVEQAIGLFWPAYMIFEQIGSPNAEVTAGYLNSIYEQIGEARFQEILQSIQNQPEP